MRLVTCRDETRHVCKHHVDGGRRHVTRRTQSASVRTTGTRPGVVMSQGGGGGGGVGLLVVSVAVTVTLAGITIVETWRSIALSTQDLRSPGGGAWKIHCRFLKSSPFFRARHGVTNPTRRDDESLVHDLVSLLTDTTETRYFLLFFGVGFGGGVLVDVEGVVRVVRVIAALFVVVNAQCHQCCLCGCVLVNSFDRAIISADVRAASRAETTTSWLTTERT
jgi:hypothetical protein